MLPSFLLTMIRSAFRGYAPSGSSSVRWVCAHCGLGLTGLVKDGTSSFSFELAIRAYPPKSSRRKHVVVLTPEGNFSISCAPVTADETASGDSGPTDGTSCSPKNSARVIRNDGGNFIALAHFARTDNPASGTDPLTWYLFEPCDGLIQVLDDERGGPFLGECVDCGRGWTLTADK